MTAELDRLAEEFWDAVLAADPAQGTAIGEHRYGDRLSDITPEGRAALSTRFEEIQAALTQAVGDRLTLLAADSHAFTVDAMSGPQSSFMSIPSYQPLRDVADG